VTQNNSMARRRDSNSDPRIEVVLSYDGFQPVSRRGVLQVLPCGFLACVGILIAAGRPSRVGGLVLNDSLLSY